MARQAILGISAFYHDSAAALLIDGQIAAAAQEERFSRKRHDASFPINACRYVLDEGGIPYDALAGVAFYDKPFLKFERLLETYLSFAPRGFSSFRTALPVWIKDKLFQRGTILQELKNLQGGLGSYWQQVDCQQLLAEPEGLGVASKCSVELLGRQHLLPFRIGVCDLRRWIGCAHSRLCG